MYVFQSVDDESRPHSKLTITSGRGGSRLSHTHTQQFYFVMQTMLLWREVLSNIYDLWQKAEDDFIDGTLANIYVRLQNLVSYPYLVLIQHFLCR